MTTVFDLEGKESTNIELPEVFNTPVRKDLINRAVVSIQSHRLQPYGPNWFSGKDTSAFSFGPGRGLSRIPRVTGGGSNRGRGSIVPQAVGGRRAHPPVPERILSKKVNAKERVLATASAIAATADEDLVRSRGHNIESGIQLPLVVSDDFEALSKTKDVIAVLSKLGMDSDLKRARTKTIRAGKGTKRGRKYKRKKSLLVVLSKKEGIALAARNIAGVDVTTAKDLNAEDLAPGAKPARLTLYTVSALNELQNRFEGVL